MSRVRTDGPPDLHRCTSKRRGSNRRGTSDPDSLRMSRESRGRGNGKDVLRKGRGIRPGSTSRVASNQKTCLFVMSNYGHHPYADASCRTRHPCIGRSHYARSTLSIDVSFLRTPGRNVGRRETKGPGCFPGRSWDDPLLSRDPPPPQGPQPSTGSSQGVDSVTSGFLFVEVCVSSHWAPYRTVLLTGVAPHHRGPSRRYRPHRDGVLTTIGPLSEGSVVRWNL